MVSMEILGTLGSRDKLTKIICLPGMKGKTG